MSNVSQFVGTAAITGITGSGALVLATSPALVGTPTAPTSTAADNTTKIATTAFVQAEIATGVASKADSSTVATKADSSTVTALAAQAAMAAFM